MHDNHLPRRALTFAAASFSILTAFGASALPVPLMAHWTEAFHLTTGDIGMTVAAYVAGCFLALLFFMKARDCRDDKRPAHRSGHRQPLP